MAKDKKPLAPGAPMDRQAIMELNKARPRVEQRTNKVHGWSVFLRVMGGAERDDYDSENYPTDDKGKIAFKPRNARARLAVRCLCDESGKRLFKDSEADFLGGMPGGGIFLDWVYDQAMEVNCMRREDEENAEKNSGSTASSSSGICSPPTNGEALESVSST